MRRILVLAFMLLCLFGQGQTTKRNFIRQIKGVEIEQISFSHIHLTRVILKDVKVRATLDYYSTELAANSLINLTKDSNSNVFGIPQLLIEANALKVQEIKALSNLLYPNERFMKNLASTDSSDYIGFFVFDSFHSSKELIQEMGKSNVKSQFRNQYNGEVNEIFKYAEAQLSLTVWSKKYQRIVFQEMVSSPYSYNFGLSVRDPLEKLYDKLMNRLSKQLR